MEGCSAASDRNLASYLIISNETFTFAVANNGNVDENNVQLYLNSVKRKSLDGFFLHVIIFC